MKILLAVSGGIDSMCMANLLTETYKGDSFAVAHCNFHLRGSESDGDAAFVKEWCEVHGMRCYSIDFDTEGYARQQRVSIEMAARELRYEWFAKLCESEGFDAVAVAHNANDNAETLVLNLLRGTGSRGIRGISADSQNGVRILRPLLGWTREDIHEWMTSHGYSWREDSTNACSEYKRNRIRNEVFPVFKTINPSFIHTFGENMKRFAQVDDIAEDYFRSAESQVRAGKHEYLWEPLRALKHWKYVLYRLLEPYGFSEQTLEKLMELVESGRTLSGKSFESASFVLKTGSDSFTVQPRLVETAAEVLVEGPGSVFLGGTSICIERISRKRLESLKQPEGVIVMAAEALDFPFTIRRWKEGDWLSPLGMRGRKKKVSDLLVDLHITGAMKDCAYVVVDRSQKVKALVGYRIDESVKVLESTEDVIKLTIA
ncbi:MAG: tRNA lysidine(34) synthetase TilS [Bacteroidales bacterium]|nr:tRNA lysidine(34) synthetase TilS [Bacteroidales bacterium]